MVMFVLGYRLCILFIVSCRFFGKFGSGDGLL